MVHQIEIPNRHYKIFADESATRARARYSLRNKMVNQVPIPCRPTFGIANWCQFCRVV